MQIDVSFMNLPDDKAILIFILKRITLKLEWNITL